MIMSLFSSPAEHAANPPASWVTVKRDNRSWSLQTSNGTELERFTTKRKAEAAKVSGFYVSQYAKEARWYAGEVVPGWKSYAECEQEARRTRERWSKPRVSGDHL